MTPTRRRLAAAAGLVVGIVLAIIAVLLWRSGIETTGEPWRINNSFTSLYARLLLDRHPEWAGRIETRALATERT